MMKGLVFIMLVAGTIVGAVGGARLPEADPFVSGAGIALLFVAAVLVRVGQRRRAAEERREGGPSRPAAGGRADEIIENMRRVVAKVDSLVSRAPDLSLTEIVARIDELERAHLRGIVDGVPVMMAALGGPRYAEVFGTWASGERMLARAWSAAADEHREESLASLRRAAERVRQAVDTLDREEPLARAAE